MNNTWTRDAAGEYVRWNKPPYRNPVTGQLSLLLPGEDNHAIEDLALSLKRIKEYYLLVLRDSKKIADVKKATSASGEIAEVARGQSAL